ncbi:hypothetical protein [Flavivirga rizhaonensis]|uniref:Uncharacterized protein n=1 Tax=Flavivirga rizhaonensis TaxID=2559571 RepID=A0A4S1DZK5_9FLAO|nr:hypothetical protein [Flavivirga rizhaonensis]TGV03599.1 hypothetical protein EM932_06120 [Flavivirga rizhaonensis]
MDTMLCVIIFQDDRAFESFLCILRIIRKAGGQTVGHSMQSESLIIKIESENPDAFHRRFKVLYSFNYRWIYIDDFIDGALDNVVWEKLYGII